MSFQFQKQPGDIQDFNKIPNDTAYDYCKTLIKDFDFALDIGAHIGTMARKMAADFKQVECFEPMFYKYTKLNTEDLDNVIVHPFGLGNENKTEELFVMSDKTSGSSIVQHPNRRWQSKAPKSTIDIKTLDSIADYEKIDFIKIDVESYEYFVIDGARELLEKHSPVIMIEYLDRYKHPTRPPMMTHQILLTLGYKDVNKIKDDAIYIKP